MRFKCVNYAPATGRPNEGYIVFDNWDDSKYKTLRQLYLTDKEGALLEIGSVKIAKFNMGRGGGNTVLSANFDELGLEYFSLGQDITYYERLNELGTDVANEVLRALRDVAADEELWRRAQLEDVTQKSLLRSVDPVTVEGQFRRHTKGKKSVIAYEFSYTKMGLRNGEGGNLINFSVVPNSNPPSNIHAIIGGNGAGKTWMLNQMRQSLASEQARDDAHGILSLANGSTDFAGLVTVSFSAFDNRVKVDTAAVGKRNAVRTASIGLKKEQKQGDATNPRIKTAEDLEIEFAGSLKKCLVASRATRWIETLKFLQTDPILAEIDLKGLIFSSDMKRQAMETFRGLGSGHKIVILTLTRLVELVQERTLVLLDEPETHLHPPLLSAFIHALSYLLIQTNGVAIAATHSPVVLQEIPKSCVWIIDRSGHQTVARRPSLETFAENVGELTHEVFALEVSESGYHSRLKKASIEFHNYRAALESFDGQLGMEGRAIMRALISMSESDD